MLGLVSTQPEAFTWDGNRNFTYAELYDYLFDGKQEVVEGLTYWDADNNEPQRIERKIWPYDKCVEFPNYSTTPSFGVNEDVDVYLVDPNRYINHRVMKSAMKKETIYQYASEQHIKQQFDSFYTVKISVEKLRSETGICRVYSHEDGFNNCAQV